MPLLILICLLQTPPTVYWRFPDAHGLELRAAVTAARGDQLAGHLITEEEIDAWLATRRLPADLGCLADSATCPNPRRGVLAALGATAEVEATGAPTDTGFRVTLRRVPVIGTEMAEFTGHGDTLEAAAADAVGRIRGYGTVEVAVAAEGARVFVDDQPAGLGPGSFLVAPGSHRVRVEAPGRRPVEQPVQVEVGQTRTLAFDLPEAYGELTLTVAPPEAQVFLDGQLLEKPEELREVPPGVHRLRITAEGYEPLEQELTIKSATRLDLTIGLQKAEAEWIKALRTPHEDPLAHPWYVRARLRVGGVGAGTVDASTGRGATAIEVDRQKEAVVIGGLEIGAGWRGRYLVVDALTLALEGGGGAPARFERDDLEGDIEDLLRVTLRPAWVGVRYPAWRLEPYFMGGLAVVFESLDVKTRIAGTDTEGDAAEIDHALLLLGLELGVRYFFTPEWYAVTGFTVELWPGARTSGALVLGGGYTFDLPEWL